MYLDSSNEGGSGPTGARDDDLLLPSEGLENEISVAANNYANSLTELKRYQEAKKVMRKTTPVARRLGESHQIALRARTIYALTLFEDTDATLGDVREAVEMLEETERIARRVLGGAHPLTAGMEKALRAARASIAARETPPPPDAS